MANGIVNPYDELIAAEERDASFDELVGSSGPSDKDKLVAEGDKAYDKLFPPTGKDNQAGNDPNANVATQYLDTAQKTNADVVAAQAAELSNQPEEWVFKGPFDLAKYNQIQGQEPLISSAGGADTGRWVGNGTWSADGQTWIPAAVGGTPEDQLVWVKKGPNTGQYRYPSKYGIRSRSPRSTPKYNQYLKQGHREFLQTTARMYISVTNPKAFINEVGKDQHLKGIARVLAGSKSVEDSGKGYIDFLLLEANHALNEKVQIVETLSDNYVAFFFGQSAPIFQYGGALMNSYQDDWAINMLRMYQNISRGSQLARRGVLFYLKYDSMVVSGSLLNFNWKLNGDNELIVPFNFSMLIRKIHIIYGGLEPPTDFMVDTSLDPASSANAFWPKDYNPNEIGSKALKAKVMDGWGGETPYGTGAAATVDSTPAAESTKGTEKKDDQVEQGIAGDAPTQTVREVINEQMGHLPGGAPNVNMLTINNPD